MSTRWQYNVVEIKPTMLGTFKQEAVQEVLARQGQLGWELVTIVAPGPMMALIAIFKRRD
ncbi:DUF4177 domain-containing protein [Pseudoxanthomonas suwonensis]|uniref:DUF4177 domain-containing protein n=1 Tax=Pseudoxanthomonas suwonensis TaxID=314722 RepID=UPI00048DA09F|nr:DUF4177 domain-containing protein [Pseudoxanthomonas suwonensis]